MLVWFDLESCETWAKTSHSYGKATANSLGGSVIWVGWSLRCGIWLPALWFCGGRAQKRDNSLYPHFCLENTVPQLLPWCQTLQFLPECQWCLSSCYPGAGAQREWIWVSPCMGSLRRTSWDSRGFFHELIPCWYLQSEVMRTYLPDTGTLGWGDLVWGWNSLLPRYPSQIFIHYTWKWDQPILCLCPSYQGWMDVVFFNL